LGILLGNSKSFINFKIMPYLKVNLHLVFSTKYRLPHLSTPQLRRKMWFHIKDNAKINGIHVDYANGFEDHCHCLISMNSTHSISYLVQMIKGESANWMNESKVIPELFEWQNGYFVVAVEDCNIFKVREYIKNQETHHKTQTSEEEFNEMILIHGFKKILDD
jgi:putative transposase